MKLNYDRGTVHEKNDDWLATLLLSLFKEETTQTLGFPHTKYGPVYY